MSDSTNDIKDDEQERKNLANHIAKIIKTNKEREDDLSIAITAGWGYGKTYFLDKHLEKAIDPKIKIIRINAHELDYAQDPFLMLGSKLSSDNEQAKEAFKKLLGYGFKQVANLADKAHPGAGAILKFLSSLTSQNLNAFETMEKDLDKLKTEIKKGGQKVVIIDELDRCKPEFADALLEAVKHFFNVPNISFILALNLDEANFLNDKRQRIYYEKFFDYTFDLPKLSYQFFINQKISKAAGSLDWLKENDYIADISLFCKESLFNISLRQLDKILTQMSLLSIDRLKDFEISKIRFVNKENEQKFLEQAIVELSNFSLKDVPDSSNSLYARHVAERNRLMTNKNTYEISSKTLFDINFKNSLKEINSKRLFILLCLFKHSTYYNTINDSHKKTNQLADMYKHLFETLNLSDNTCPKASDLKIVLSGFDEKTPLDDKDKIEPYYNSIINFASFV